jgi:predicted histidine transporter YuiF (NhaC family)
VIVAVYIGIGDATMAVHLSLTQTIWLASGYYIIGIWLALWLMLHASRSYKHGKQAHQATIINLATQKQWSDSQTAQESFKNLFD